MFKFVTVLTIFTATYNYSYAPLDIITKENEKQFTGQINKKPNDITPQEYKILIESKNNEVVKGLWTEEVLLAFLFIFVAAVVAYRRLTGIAG